MNIFPISLRRSIPVFLVVFVGLLSLLPTASASTPEVRWKITEAGNKGVEALTFSPDSQMLASGGSDYQVTVRLVSDGQVIKTLEGNRGTVWDVAFSPNGKYLASAGGQNDKSIWFWQASDWQFLGLLPYEHYDGARAVAFSPDSQFVASGGEDGLVNLAQTSDGALLRTMTHGSINPSYSVYSVAFSPDGQILASGGGDSKVKLWRVSDGQLLQTFVHGVSTTVGPVAFSPDGKILASGGGADGANGQSRAMIKLWRVSDGQLLQTLDATSFSVLSLAFSPDGQTLASAGWDQKLKFWRVSDGQLLLTYDNFNAQPMQRVAFSPDGKSVAFCDVVGLVAVMANPMAGGTANPDPTPIPDPTPDPDPTPQGNTLVGRWVQKGEFLSYVIVFYPDGRYVSDLIGGGVHTYEYGVSTVNGGKITLSTRTGTAEYAFTLNNGHLNVNGPGGIAVDYTKDPGSEALATAQIQGFDARKSAIDAQWRARFPVAVMAQQPPSPDFSIGEIPVDPNSPNVFPTPKVFTSTQLYVYLGSLVDFVDSTGVQRTGENTEKFYLLPTGRFFYKSVSYHKGDPIDGSVFTTWGRYKVDESVRTDMIGGLADSLTIVTDAGETVATELQDGRRNLYWTQQRGLYGNVIWAQEEPNGLQIPNPNDLSTPPPAMGGLKGDVSGDGKINIQDALMALQASVGSLNLPADQKDRADINSDGKVNIQDAILILRKAIGL